MEGANAPTFRPTLTVWPAEPPGPPTVVVQPLRRVPNDPDTRFTSWDPHPEPSPTVALPEDFCLRECLATDPDDLDAVFDFISHWGRLSPLEAHLRGPLDSLPASLDWLIPQLASTNHQQTLTRAAAGPDVATTPAHSLIVEAHYLRVLRALTRHVIHANTGRPPAQAWTDEGFRDDDPEPWGAFVVTMNAALKPFSVHVAYPGADTLLDAPSTYETAVLQLAGHIAENRQVNRPGFRGGSVSWIRPR